MKKIIIGLAGEMASGKGIISDYLKAKHDAQRCRFSDAFRDILFILGLKCSRKNLSNLSISLRETFGEDILSASMAKKAEKSEKNIVVVDGIRREDDIAHLKKIPGFKMVFIEASLDTRYERLVKRGENSGDSTKTLEEFKEDHKRNTELSIRRLKDNADDVIENNGSLEDLYEQIDNLLKSYTT